MIWWIAQPSRARSEGFAIDALQEQHEWLRNVEWTFGKGGSLSANFEIERLGRLIPLMISYPRFFPDMPPQVFPRDEIRLSSHQWGAGGELCLEYRPDNWDPAFTGAMMIESAYRLLQGEEPAQGVAARVESAHATTVGQDIRTEYDLVKVIADTIGHEGLLGVVRGSEEDAVVLVECEGDFHLMWLPSGRGPRDMIGYTTVKAPSSANRLPGGYDRLASASVGIVGCGSVGSKIAASLARAGLGRFVLVDGDVLFPGNLVRNDLDWRSVGLNKPDAVAKRIREIKPSAHVTVRRLKLGGQESSSSTDSALVEVGGCDLIIDATADPQIFNLCASVARSEKRTLVWGEVFAGGIGGLVVRLRPDIEPVPHAARRQLLRWCDDRGRPMPLGEEVQYGLALDESPPLIRY